MAMRAPAPGFPAPKNSIAGTIVLAAVVSVVTIAVVAVMVIAFVVKRSENHTKQVALACSTIRDSTTLFLSNSVGAECPTVEELKHERFLSTDFSAQDPWGGTYKIVCDGSEVTVSSLGPDKSPGTADDIVFPPRF